MARNSRTPDFQHRTVTVEGALIHVVDAGPRDGRALFFLHGWPEDWSAFEPVMALAAQDVRVVAIDLPGIGGSKTAPPSGVKSGLARSVMAVADELELQNLTIVGHDAGGMIAYACLRNFEQRLASVVILNTVIPGISPWEEVIRNPHIWHFAFHSIPDLPERLVSGKEREYFDYFYAAIAAHPEAIPDASRQRYAAAYGAPSALKAGFDWYRAFREDAAENSAARPPVRTPLFYVRGEKDVGKIEPYVEGFRAAGVVNVSSALIADSGHFAPEEQPGDVWSKLREHLNAR